MEYFNCYDCYFYSSKTNTCDMCDEGGWFAINNHGKKVKDVIKCDVYKKDKDVVHK